jgi:UDP-galactopyranose mutase
VFEYLSNFTEWLPYEHKVLACHKGQLYPIPINRRTINKLYGKDLKSDSAAEEFYASVRENINTIQTSRDIVLNKMGNDLYERFYRHFTKKQWDLYPEELAPSVCGRIPLRTNDDCRYFTDKYQFMPKEGYHAMIKKMLDHRNIEIVLDTDYRDIQEDIQFSRMVYTGPIDYYFDYAFGKLPYRSIRFEFEHHAVDSYQEAAQINYVDPSIKFTRVIEHKKLSLQNINGTTISREYPIDGGEPFYPVPAEKNRQLFRKYFEEANKLNSVIFCGRLAEYQYYNMDQVVGRVLNLMKLI